MRATIDEIMRQKPESFDTLLSVLREKGWEIEYIGAYNGIEKELIEKEGIKFFGISTGKLRRYLSKKHYSCFRVIKGVSEARK